MKYNIIKYDPYLADYSDDISLRMDKLYSKRAELLQGRDITEIANGYKYFGIHKTKNGWVYREWAPGSDKMYFTGDFNNWNIYSWLVQKYDIAETQTALVLMFVGVDILHINKLIVKVLANVVVIVSNYVLSKL